jgi:SdpC family antimicrobial peptide
MSGEDLFKGCFFGVGPGAAFFPEVWENPQVKARMESATRGVPRQEVAAFAVAHIREKDAGFFDRFGRDLQSGDHVLVARALEESKKHLVEGGKAYRSSRSSTSNVAGTGVGGDDGGGSDPNIGVWFYYDVAVALDIAVAVAIVAFAVVGAEADQSALQHDTWVNGIAQKDWRQPAR